MDIASVQEILDNISRGRCFSAQLDSGAFCIKIDSFADCCGLKLKGGVG